MKRPLLLSIGMFAAGALGALMLIALGAAVLDVGQFTIDGRAVSGPAFLRNAGIVWFVIAATLAFIAYALAHHQRHSRTLILLFWIILGAEEIGRALGAHGEWSVSLVWLLGLAASAAYLYVAPGARSYYQQLAGAA